MQQPEVHRFGHVPARLVAGMPYLKGRELIAINLRFYFPLGGRGLNRGIRVKGGHEEESENCEERPAATLRGHAHSFLGL